MAYFNPTPNDPSGGYNAEPGTPQYDSGIAAGWLVGGGGTTTPTPTASTSTTSSTITSAPTASDIYAGIDYETPEEKAFREAQGKSYLDEANSTIDEEKIRRDTLAKFQAEIDALTKVYEEKKRVERIAGEGRMGSVAAIGARRGLLGSDFGVAQENMQATENQSVINAIEDEKSAKISAIHAAARGMAQKEIDDKVSAKKLGAENYLKYISESSERKKANVEAIVKRLYDTKTYDGADIKGIAESLGVSVDTIRNVYKDYEKKAKDALIKDNIKLSEGESIYNPNTGKIEYTAPKTSKPISMSPGSVLVDDDGNILLTVPEKPKNPMDYVKEVDGNLLRYNPDTDEWSTVYEKETNTKAEKITIGGVDYIVTGTNADGTPILKKPTVPVNPEVQQAIDDTKSLVDSIYSHKGLNSSVGPNALTRVAIGDAFGNKQDFIGKVQQLVDNITMKKLIEVKGQGATFGALSDSERRVIERAATPINQWIVRNKKGEVTGYNIDQKSFKKELDRIKSQFGTQKTDTQTPQTVDDLYRTSPEKRTQIEQMIRDNMSDEDILQVLGFNNVGSDTNKAVSKVWSIPNGTKGGQCGRFVNKLTGLGVGDSYQSKISKMDPSIKTPEPGMVFVMPYQNTGHIGFIVSVNDDGTVTVKDSNFNLDEKIGTHKIALSNITGLARV